MEKALFVYGIEANALDGDSSRTHMAFLAGDAILMDAVYRFLYLDRVRAYFLLAAVVTRARNRI